MKAFIFFCFLGFTPLFVLSETLLLKGTVGKSPIVMQLEIEDNENVYGNYFYTKTGLNIPFEGVTLDKKFSFHAGSRFNEKEKQELFVLDRKGDSFTGKWTFNGKTLTVNLERITKDDVKHPYAINPYLRDENFDDLDYYRSSLAQFERMDSITVINGVSLQWFRETHSGIEIYRVVKGLPMDQITFVNNYLEALQVEAFTHYGSCSYGGDETEYSVYMSYTFVNKDFLSFAMGYNYYCGGAHPDYSTNFHNLDLKNQKKLNADDILQFEGIVSKEDNYSLWSIYRENSFGPIINGALQAAYPAYFQNENENESENEEYYEGEDCNYNNPALWAFSDVLITETGLQFSAYFPRYMRSCDDPEWAVLPYSELKEFINPAYKSALLSIE